LIVVRADPGTLQLTQDFVARLACPWVRGALLSVLQGFENALDYSEISVDVDGRREINRFVNTGD
jgi:hypothetical protein